MIEHINFATLCMLIREGKQPDEIKMYGVKYTWEQGTYMDEHGDYITATAMLSLACKRDIIQIVPQVLDEVEKKYIMNIIKPFRDKVRFISKVEIFKEGTENLVIAFNNDAALMLFPAFKKGKMYKGMAVNETYTLEELGL